MLAKNKKKFIIGTIIVFILLCILGIILFQFFSKNKSNQPTFLDTIQNLSNYKFTLEGKANGQNFYANGTSKIMGYENKFQFSFHKDDLEYEVGDIEYIVNYDTKKFFQNIYFENNLLATNTVFEDEKIEIQNIDFTRILILLGEYLNNENAVCENEECLYIATEVEKNKLLAYINLVTLNSFDEFSVNLDKLEIKYNISFSELKIKKVTIIFNDINKLELSFVY